MPGCFQVSIECLHHHFLVMQSFLFPGKSAQLDPQGGLFTLCRERPSVVARTEVGQCEAGRFATIVVRYEILAQKIGTCSQSLVHF